MTRRVRRGPRAVVTAALLAVLLPAVAGCGAGFGAQTVQQYTPADGVNADVGDMLVRDATLVTAEPGGPASLVVSFVNEGDAPDRLTRVRLAGSAAEATISDGALDLPSGESVLVGAGDGPTVTLEGPPARLAAGHFVRLDVSFARAGTTTVRVLVQAPTGEYATLAPSPSPTPTDTVTPGVTEEPTPGVTETP